MGFASMKIFVVLQLLLVLLSSVSAGEPFDKAHPPKPFHMPHPIHHSTPPSYAPAPSPTDHHHHHYHHYSHPPSHAPSHSPHSNRKLVAVQGVVYCKSCKYSGSETLTDATAFSDAVVKLVCYNRKHVTEVEGKTDKNGYFFIEAPKTVSTYGVHKCKVFLVSSPKLTCSLKTNLHGGVTGATLMYEKTKTPLSYALYSVGPFAFDPPKC
ncbi:non-classical arabinogalactan protein 30-like [Telopea speciosissima]|uniref:non-classical arabinogalactan protein 30-like n=1 Tax=Telopea speciosissima TaxID=54955 RepID=UPI001CC550F9|nr:non-classical arabinogalactan protein 30-like [Telopea speciosissima]